MIKSPILDLLNRIEYKAFQNFKQYIPCDALVTSLFIHPEIVTKATEWHATVELNGRETRGQLVLDHLKENRANVRIVEKIDEEDMKTIMLWVCGGDCEKVQIVSETRL